MNVNIPYLQNDMSNRIECLPTDTLSSYILTEEEQQYISTLYDDTTSIISTFLLTASVKAGSSLCTQPELNKTYARANSSSYSGEDRNNFKLFMSEQLVGNTKVNFSELRVDD